MTIEEIEEMIEDHYQNLDEPSDLRDIFKQVLIKFVQFHHVEDELYNSLFCTIHYNFEGGHNCVACNLNDSNRRIENLLLGYKHFTDPHMVMTNFILQLYLQVEQILEYLRILKLPENYVQKHFHYFYTIKRWANFLKHPKYFLLVHHPVWILEKNEQPRKGQDSELIIDTKFVNEYYAGDSKNNKLYHKLLKKENVKVIFPDPIEIIEKYCMTQSKFVEIIKNNQVVRDILNDEATITEFYNKLSSE